MPGLAEEVLFRGLLLPLRPCPPRPSPLGSQFLEAQRQQRLEPPRDGPSQRPPGAGDVRPLRWTSQEAAGLAIFILYHLDLVHSGADMRPTFTDVRFLALAAVLGAACTEVARVTGSIWPSVAMHGTWVWLWLAFGRC
mmetsp:Transcript_112446/g.351631  ORF Transcript_112446/g.351631 Transcript_112446/m.351631 type:complete len:138 (-) Transcript_112446:63-476(-)